MRVVLIVVATTVVAGALLAAAARAFYDAGRHAVSRAHLRQVGLTEGAAGRYIEAARIMERLDGRSDTLGVLAGDMLSADTQRLVSDWVTAHRKEFTRA